MTFKLAPFHRNISDEELLTDLKAVYQKNSENGQKFSSSKYESIGKYNAETLSRRFGSWNIALKKANLPLCQEKNITEKSLFQNLENVWITLGRQPVTRDLVKPLSKYTSSTYMARFGSYRKALEAFVKYIAEDVSIENNQIENNQIEANNRNSSPKPIKRTVRNISDRLRFRILVRDGFACQSCGKSPLKERGIELQVDHITPWSKGGETVAENLQAKCKQCNLGKGNAFDQ